MSIYVNSLTLTPYSLEYQEHIKRLLEADQSRSYAVMSDHIATQIVNRGVNLSLSEIEFIFRRFNAYTYLIARELHDENAYNFYENEPKRYQLFVSTRDPYLALQEVTLESKDYAENFEKLKDTGLTILKSEEIFEAKIHARHIKVVRSK